MENTYIQRLVEISKMYYEQDMTQERIAKVFNISRSAVSMALTEAKNNGIIEVRIKDPSQNNLELAAKMEAMFGLKKCVVVPSGTHNEQALLKIVASQADQFAVDIFHSHTSVGVAWGNTCYEFMKSFPENTSLCDITIVPLVGASQILTKAFQLNESVRMFSDKLRGHPTFIYAPGFCETLEDKERISACAYMEPIQDLWRHLDYAVIGIGSMGEENSLKRGTRRAKSLVDEIRTYPTMPVGDICARKINIYGEFLNNDFNSKLIGISGEDLKNTGNVIAIAVGSSKVLPIIGGLRTGAIHFFVTDENTAMQVVDCVESGLLPE